VKNEYQSKAIKYQSPPQTEVTLSHLKNKNKTCIDSNQSATININQKKSHFTCSNYLHSNDKLV